MIEVKCKVLKKKKKNEFLIYIENNLYFLIEIIYSRIMYIEFIEICIFIVSISLDFCF